MWVLLGATEYGDPLNAPTPIPVAAPAGYKEGTRKTADARYTHASSLGNSPTRSVAALQANTDTIRQKQKGSWPVTLCTDS